MTDTKSKRTRVWLKILLICILPVLAEQALAQQPQPQPQPQPDNPWNPVGRPGIGVDARGGQVIDPTKNVLDLVEAAIRRQDDLRVAEAKLQDALRIADARLSTAMRVADSQRLGDLRDAGARA